MGIGSPAATYFSAMLENRGSAAHVATGNKPSLSANIQIRKGPNTTLEIDTPNTATNVAV